MSGLGTKAKGFDVCNICKIEFEVIGYYVDSSFIETIAKVRFCPVCGNNLEQKS